MTTLTYSDYNSPKDLLADETLSDEQKLSLLEKWALDEEALQRAAAEGLSGGEQSNLRAVQSAISKLK